MAGNDNLSESIEEYLESMYRHGRRGELVSTTRLSDELKVAPSSVTEMLKKLDREGYINYYPYKGAKLTDKGMVKAKSMARKHRLLEKFLYDILKIREDKVHDEACEMEHTLSDDAERALCQLLNKPYECPDEELIPECNIGVQTCEECDHRKDEEIEEIGTRRDNLIPITDLNDKQSAKISFIRGNYDVLKHLLSLGLTVGSELTMLNTSSIKGPVQIKVRDSNLAIGHDVASNIFVEKI